MLWKFSFEVKYYKALKDEESQTVTNMFQEMYNLYQFSSACVCHGMQYFKFNFKGIK